MPTVFLRRISAALCAALLAACSDTPSSPLAPSASRVASGVRSTNATSAANATGAARELQEFLYDLSDSFVQFPCGDGYTEVVRLEGQIYERWTVMRDAAGGLHASFHTMPVGLRGVGQESGAEYHISQRESGNFNETMMAVNSRYASKMNVHAPALGLRARLVLGGHYTINANGEVVVEREVLRAECSQ